MGSRPRLPIDEVLEPLVEHLRAPGSSAVVLAPPGAGKTTGLPLALLGAGGSGQEAGAIRGEILVAQPRRLAARMAATLAARFHGAKLGDEVGYRVRYDSKAGPDTRLCYLTDGLLLRRIREDPTLAGVDVVVLDEFHERKLQGDLTLALLRRAQRGPRPDLRVVVMSATLDPGPIADYLGARAFESKGRAFDVELEYAPLRDRPLASGVLRALTRRIEAAGRVDVEGLGHVLVFLPGAYEIRACESALRGYCAHHKLRLLTLHGELKRELQDEAVGPSDRPKVILSTNVAETSVTIDEVATVIDSGLARVSRYDPWSGLAELQLRPISRASAEQRAGRAGRTRPGHCIRLYAKADLERRPAREAAEVARAELSGAVFELASAGAGDPSTFEWFEAPPAASIEAASTLLRGLDAVSAKHTLTQRGRKMRRWSLHPRLARVMVDAVHEDCGPTAAYVCALLEERPLRRSDRPAARPDDADVFYELSQLRARAGAGASNEPARARGLDPKGVEAVRRAARSLARRLDGGRKGGSEPRDVHLRLRRILLGAFFDKVARVRERDGKLEAQTLDGSAIPLAPACVVREDPWLLALQVRARKEGTRSRVQVTSACAVDLDWILEDRLDEIEERRFVTFDRAQQRVEVHERLCLGELELETSLVPGRPEELADGLFAAASELELRHFCDVEALERLRARVDFAQRCGFEVGGPGALDEAQLRTQLRELCVGRSTLAQLRKAKLLDLVIANLGEGSRMLDRVAPLRVRLAGGRSVDVNYAIGQAPSIASFLQDFFGSSDGPKLADGREAVVLHLRAPNRRDVQVTTDLAGFWERHYPALRKQLMRRYPRHPWPEDPLSAKPPAPRPRRPRRGGKK